MFVGLSVVILGFMQPIVANSRKWFHLHPHKDSDPRQTIRERSLHLYVCLRVIW